MSKKWGVTKLLLIVLFLGSAHAQEEASVPFQWTGPGGKINQSITGYLQPIEGIPSYQERLDLELEAGVTNYTYGAKLVPWVYARAPEMTAGDRRWAKVFFDAKEAWVERTTPVWDLRLGNQIITWGAADQINPTDLWNPRDLYDPFQNIKLPMLTGRLNFHPPDYDTFALEILASPFFRESRLPISIPDEGTVILNKSESRWLLPMPNKVSTNNGFTAPLDYRIESATYPTTWQAGARLQLMRISGWDFSVSTLNAVEKIPRMTFTRKGNPADPNLPITITLLPSYHRLQMFGADATGSIVGKNNVFGIRGEAAYVIRDNHRAKTAPSEFQADLTKDDYIHAVAGIDHTIEKKILDTVVYANLMGVFFQRVTNHENAPGRVLVEGLPSVDPWDRNLILYLEDRMTPKFKVSNTFLTSLRNWDGLVSPAMHAQITDNFKATLSADFFFKSTLEGFYGQYVDNRRINFILAYAF